MDHIVFAHALTGDLAGQNLDGARVAEVLRSPDLGWVHLDAMHPDTRPWIEQNLSYLDRHTIDALLAEETRPRATQMNNGMLLILRGVNLNEGADPEDMVSIRLWVDPERIVSMRRRRVRAAIDIEERIRDGRGPDSSGAFVALLVARLTERVEPVLRALDDEADALEEGVVDQADPMLRRPITDVRRRTIHLRRYLGPQRDAVAAIRTMTLDWLTETDKRHLIEAQDKLTRTIEDLDAIRERAQIVKDELANALAERLNRNMYVLSVIAAIFLPLGFLTGLLGINVGGMPGAENGSAFWIVSAAMAILVGVQVAVFRWLRWF